MTRTNKKAVVLVARNNLTHPSPVVRAGFSGNSCFRSCIEERLRSPSYSMKTKTQQTTLTHKEISISDHVFIIMKRQALWKAKPRVTIAG